MVLGDAGGRVQVSRSALFSLVYVSNLVCFMHIDVHACVCLRVYECFPHLRKDNVLHSTGEQSHY